MIFQVIIGALVARKVWKIYKKNKELRDLQIIGQEIGLPFISGENVEEYRQRLITARDNRLVENINRSSDV